MDPKRDTQNWPELAIGLYDKLTGRGAEITYQMQNLEIMVPSSADNGASHAKWVVDGSLSITTRDSATA